MRGLTLVLCVLGVAGAVRADPPPPAPSPSPNATEVSGVTVTARRVPKVSEVEVVAQWCPKADPERHPGGTPAVVATYPQPGAVVRPGPLTLRITFDQPMTCSWAVEYESKGAEPCRPVGDWALPARRTWQVRCDLRAGSGYRMHFGEPDGVRFTALSGHPADPYTLEFSTSDDSPVRSEPERLAGEPLPALMADGSGYVECADDSDAAATRRCRHVVPPVVGPDPAR